MKIGIMLPFGEDEADRRVASWAELRDLAMTAEETGLDSIYGADHLIFRGDRIEGIREGWTALTAVAAVTSRVEVGPLVLAVPFRNPALTAKMAAELDEVSGGRFVLGLGCGWHEPEFRDFDFPFDHRVGRFEEALQVILPLVREGRVSYKGRWHRADTELRPRGPRPAGMPILIAGKGPRMMQLVARHADRWNAAWFGEPQGAHELDDRVSRLRAACEAEGRDIATLTLTAGVFVDFPELARDGDEEPPDEAMRGTAEEIASMLAGYADHGIDELIVHFWPRRPEAVAELAKAATLARGLVAARREGAAV
jgi:alkanesulfonate monooxygenase SsuD/methylene tetrahydromethanopterin reductase-like flavin-dependent oxidoreductase (luciferase family)